MRTKIFNTIKDTKNNNLILKVNNTFVKYRINNNKKKSIILTVNL
jgi:hypothetical protein